MVMGKDMSSHRKLKHYLAELDSGELEGALEDEVRSHSDECELCQRWLASYRLIKLALDKGSKSTPEWHPEPEELVRVALSGGTGEDVVPSPAAAHLHECAQCALEVRLCHEAIAAAGPAGRIVSIHRGGRTTKSVSPWNRTPEDFLEVPSSHSELGPGRRRRYRLQTVAAACIAAAILVGSLLYLAGTHSPPSDLVVRDQVLAGERTIEATDKIEVSQSRIDLGAKVTLRASKVVLGNGFSLGEGASLTIGGRDGASRSSIGRTKEGVPR